MSQFSPTRTRRFIKGIPVLYRLLGDEEWQRGITINVSESGMLLKAPEPVRLTSRLELTFHLAERLGNLGPEEVRCVGEVVRHGLPTQSVPYPIGIQFVQGSWKVAHTHGSPLVATTR